MATASTNGRTEPFTKASGRITKPMAKELSGTVEVTFMLENFSMTRHMDLECIFTRMEAGMKAIGSMMCKKDKAKSCGWMARRTWETIKMG